MPILKKVPYFEADYSRVREFLVNSLQHDPESRNWQIDRWNFCRYVSQTIHETTDNWPETVGLWVDGSGEIQAVVNSEGENRGEAYFQLVGRDYSNQELNEFLDHAEQYLALVDEEGCQHLDLHIEPDYLNLVLILEERGYLRAGIEQAGFLDIIEPLEVTLPESIRLVDSTGFKDQDRALAHSLAFGYAEDSPLVLKDYHIVEAFENMRSAPDYRDDLDLALLTPSGDVAAFANFWFDEVNQIGILEPLGTIPDFQKQGLARALISEGVNRLLDLGAKRLYGGAGQEFYLRFGFETIDFREIWSRAMPGKA